MTFSSSLSVEFIVYHLLFIFQKPVFEGVAHEALSECMVSLQCASDAIKDKKVNLAITNMFVNGSKGVELLLPILNQDVSINRHSSVLCPQVET